MVESAQTDKEEMVVYLYASDKTAQFSYIRGAEEKGYNVLLMNGQLDQHEIGQLEQKLEKTRFVRVDSDTPERLIPSKDEKVSELTELEIDMLTSIFKSQLPEMKDVNFIVEQAALTDKEAPAVITQNEMMRRMKDMAGMQPGMNFYGKMPDMYSLVVNTEQSAVKRILDEAKTKVGEKIKMVKEEIDALNSQTQDLRKKLDDKDADKDALNREISEKESEISKARENENTIIAEFATKEPVVKQMIDLALLQSGLLKGEALSEFIKRSVSLLS